MHLNVSNSSTFSNSFNSAVRFSGLNQGLKKLQAAQLPEINVHALSASELLDELESHSARMNAIRSAQPSTDQMLRNADSLAQSPDDAFWRTISQMGQDFEVQVAAGDANRNRLQELETQLARRLQGASPLEVQQLFVKLAGLPNYTPLHGSTVETAFTNRLNTRQ
jgi:polyhydroxyalkanoate synthesis regulator phasin